MVSTYSIGGHPRNDRCRRTLICSTRSANVRFQGGPVGRPKNRHGLLWVGHDRSGTKPGGLLALVRIRCYSLVRTRFWTYAEHELSFDMTKFRWPLAGPSVRWATPLGKSERQFGIEVGWCAIGHELTAPGALDVRAVGEPELLAHQLEALEDGEGLLGRPVRRQRERSSRSRRALAPRRSHRSGHSWAASRTRLARRRTLRARRSRAGRRALHGAFFGFLLAVRVTLDAHDLGAVHQPIDE